MSRSVFGKYKGIVVSIALFLILDASVLMLNFYISFQISDDAVGVNIAGRQRMLSQRMVKSLFDLRYSLENPEALSSAVNELRTTSDLFDQTLTAFERGGTVMGADKKLIYLNAATSTDAQRALVKAKRLWVPFKQAISDVLSEIEKRGDVQFVLEMAIDRARTSNLELLAVMNDLTVDLESTATAKAIRLRWIQTIGISLAIINFLIILFHFLGQLRRHDRELDAARRETTDILNTVNEGLFLLDQHLVISSQHSAKLESLFGGKSVANRSFAELLKDLVCDKDMETAQRFVNLLFRKDIRSNLIGDLNPLDEVEINIPDQSGGFNTRYLSFEFKRVLDVQEVSGILVTVNDITEKVLLARELAQTRAQNEQQLAMLTSILHANPSMLKRFIQNAFDTFKSINALLKDQQKSGAAMRTKLNEIFVEIHSFKGEASAHQLDNFADLAHEFEHIVHELKDKFDLNGNDFLKLTVQLEKLFRHAEAMQTLADKLAGFAVASDGARAKRGQLESLESWGHLFDLTQSVARRLGKSAYLVMTGFTEVKLSEAMEQLVSDLCVQFIRNSIVHGLELPHLRKSLKKPESGRIDVRMAQLPDGRLELVVTDDGRGFDYELIRRKALATGRWSAEELASWNNKRLLLLIFEHGFSTAAHTTEDAGRGVGMDVIVSRIQRIKGSIRVVSRLGKLCQFTVILPEAEIEQRKANAA